MVETLKLPDSISFESRTADLAKTKADIEKQQEPIIAKAKADVQKAEDEGSAKTKSISEEYSKASTEARDWAGKNVPAPLKQEEYKEKPLNEKELTVAASILGAFALIASKGSSAPMVAAMDAMSGAMNGYKAGHDAEAKKQLDQFKEKSTEALRIHQEMKDEYVRILSQKDKGVAQKLQEFNIATQQYEHKVGQAAKTLEDAYKVVNKAGEQYEKGMDAQQKLYDMGQQKIAQLEQTKALQEERMQTQRMIASLNREKNEFADTGRTTPDGNPIIINKNTGEEKSLPDVIGEKKSGAGAGGRSSAAALRYAGNINRAALEIDRSLEILAKMPVEVSGGTFGMRKSSTGFLNAPLNAVATKLTPEIDQQYQTLTSNLGISLATIDGGGYKPQQGQIDTFKQKFMWDPSTPIGQKMFSIADAIAQVEQATSYTLADTSIPQEQRDLVKNTMDHVKEKFPFTPEDVINMQKTGKTIGELFQSKKSTKSQKSHSFKEGEESKSKSGKPIIFTNGQWEYK